MDQKELSGLKSAVQSVSMSQFHMIPIANSFFFKNGFSPFLYVTGAENLNFIEISKNEQIPNRFK